MQRWSAEEQRGRGAEGKELIQSLPCSLAYLHVEILGWYTTRGGVSTYLAMMRIISRHLRALAERDVVRFFPFPLLIKGKKSIGYLPLISLIFINEYKIVYLYNLKY
jgi:hypothetical protein